jgi:hypothetical protein
MATKDFVVKNGLDVTEAAVIRDTTDSSNKDTGALIVEGGVGVEKNLNVGVNLNVGGTAAITGNTTITGDLAVNGADITTTSTGTATVFNANATTLNIGQAATTVSIGQTTGTTTVRNALTVGGAFTANSGAAAISPANANVVLSPTGTGVVTINPSTLGSINNMSVGASTRSTGAFTSLTSNAATTFTQGTGSTSTTTGTLVVTGGVGISERLYAGSLQNTPIGSVTANSAAFTTLTANNTVTFTQGTGSTSTTTGTLVVTGGVGISERLYAGSLQNTPIGSSVASSAAFTTLTANNAVTFTQNTASTSTSTGTLVVSGGIGVTGAVNAGLSSTFNGLSSTNTTSLSPANASVTISPTGTGTVTLNPATLGTINNMSIGATTASTGRFTNTTITGSLTAGGVTGSNGQALVSTGSGIAWSTPNAITFGTSNVTVADGGNITVTSAGTLITTFSNTNVNIPVTTASTSTTTGALIVAGGLGVGGRLNVGSTTSLGGAVTITTGDILMGTVDAQGITWARNTDGASIKFYNTADGDTNSRLEFNVNDNSNEDFLFTATAGGVTTELLRIEPDGGQTGLRFRGSTVWHANNDGAGSGLDADLLDGFGTSQAAAGNTIPIRDSNGYLYGNYINMSDNSQTSGVTAIICKAGDNFYRSATAAATATFISGQTMNIAGSATSLANARSINGTSFNGTADITTANWGTARTVNGVSVNGSTNYVLEPFVESDNVSATRYIVFVDSSTDGYQRLNEDADLTYNPGTNTLTCGALSATTITETSSIVYKENINPIDSALDKVLQLVGVTYDRKDGSRKNEAGLIAEEVAKIIPNIVSEKEGKPEGIQYTKLTAYLIECIKELNAKIERLEGKS